MSKGHGLSNGERKLAAIMFTDIVGYTALSQENESATVRRLEEHRKLIRPLFASHGGREIKTIGDAFLVEFYSALDALLCSIAIQQTMHDRKVARGDTLSVRIGIHVGDVIERENDILGDAVNIASRIEPLAEPGGICISGEVYSQVRNKSDLPFISLGEKSLKNVNTPIMVHRVVMPWEKETVEAVTQPDARRIAVLPFVNLSPDASDEYFADGMTEEIISTVSKIGQVEVISRTSVMQYKKNPKPIREVAKELSVGTVLEGSVRKAGNKLRITAQMIDATNDRHVWAESYDRELQDVFATQSDIARKVADALQAGVSHGKPARLESTPDLEAYTLYLRAMRLYHEAADLTMAPAIKLFQDAISKDPAFGRAYAGLAFALSWAAVRKNYSETVGRAEIAAKKALELEPDSAEAHAALAFVDGQLDRTDEAIVEAREATQINPNYAEPYFILGMEYAAIGRLGNAADASQISYRLNPLDLATSVCLATLLQLTSREPEALEVIERTKSTYPKSFWPYHSMFEFYLLRQDYAKAQEVLTEGLEINPDEEFLLMDQGRLYAMTGRRREAEDFLRVISKMEGAPRNWGQLFIHAALGNMDEAFEELMKEAGDHSWHWLMKSLPYFEEMRKDPRFAEFCKKVGLPA
jgi:adenylate cyclase